MNLLLIAEIRQNPTPPEFGGEFAAHIQRKTNPNVRNASLTAWNLLAEGLNELGLPLPDVHFGARGKPEFVQEQLHFSLAHSGKLAVALLSDAPCGVDVERRRAEVEDRLRQRCLSVEEMEKGLDFFECWTKKECIGKRSGEGIDAHPGKVDTLEARWEGRFFCREIADSEGKRYALAALCEGASELELQWR